MPIAHFPSLLIWTISLASILCMLLRPRRIAEAYWACGGAILLVLSRLLPLSQAVRALREGLDVYLFLVFDQHMPPLFMWLRIFLLPSAASILVTFLCLRWLFRSQLRGNIPGEVERLSLSTEGKLALMGLIIAAAALIVSSALGLSLGVPTCGAALFAMAVVTWRNRSIPLKVANGVSWSILPLVAGLFVIVEALQNAGLRRLGLAGLQSLAPSDAWTAKGLPAFAVALLSNAMNNLPVALMSGAALRHIRETSIIAHAILIGVDLGPNLSVTGSLATILWLIALRRENVEITAGEFFRIGLIAMPLALLASLLLLWN